jgi:hypothetical protein
MEPRFFETPDELRVRRGLDPDSYTIRFTPRKPLSIWSAVNINRGQELISANLMRRSVATVGRCE